MKHLYPFLESLDNDGIVDIINIAKDEGYQVQPMILTNTTKIFRHKAYDISNGENGNEFKTVSEMIPVAITDMDKYSFLNIIRDIVDRLQVHGDIECKLRLKAASGNFHTVELSKYHLGMWQHILDARIIIKDPFFRP